MRPLFWGQTRFGRSRFSCFEVSVVGSLRAVGLLACLCMPEARAAQEGPTPAMARMADCLRPSFQVEAARPGNSAGGYTVDVGNGPQWMLIADEMKLNLVASKGHSLIAEVTLARTPSDSSDDPTYQPASSDSAVIFDEQAALRQRWLAAVARRQGQRVEHHEYLDVPVSSINVAGGSNSVAGVTLASLRRSQTFVEYAWKRWPSHRSEKAFARERDSAIRRTLGCFMSAVGEVDPQQRLPRQAALRSQPSPADEKPTIEEDAEVIERRRIDQAEEAERRRTDTAYETAKRAMLQALHADEGAAVTQLLHDTTGEEGERLRGVAPCLAMEQSSVSMTRLAYRVTRKSAIQAAEESRNGCSPVTLAIKSGRVAMLQGLIDEGAPLTDHDMGYFIEQFFPGQERQSDSTRVAIFQALASASQAPKYEWKAHLAWAIGDEAVTAALLQHVGGLHGIEDGGRWALRQAMHMRERADAAQRRVLLSQIQKLIERGLDVNRVDVGYEAPLLAAGCDVDLVDLLLRAKADPNVVSQSGQETPLHHVLRCSDEDAQVAMATLLIAAGADVNLPRNTRPGIRRPVLAEVCESSKSPRLQQLLLTSGAKVDIPDMQGRTALMTMYRKEAKSVERLLACGAAIHSRDQNDMTALQHLIQANAIDAARVLCDQGAEPKALCSELAADRRPAATCFQMEYGPGQPAAGVRYRAKLADGRVVDGRTDAQGLTAVCGLEGAGAAVTALSD